MPDHEPENNSGDEISLVDLFVVLLKYRKMIAVIAILGLAVSVGYYLIRRGRAGPETAGLYEYEGRMTVGFNPRIGRSGALQFPGWFNSKELLDAALKEAGLGGPAPDRFTVFNHYLNTGVDIDLKPGPGDRESVEKLFSILLDKAELMASAHYAQYAADSIAYFEYLQDQGKDFSAQDYILCQWARDFLSGRDTVLKALYPPSVSGIPKASVSASPRVISLVIFFGSLFFAIFLAFVLNALKNIGADSDVMEKIRGALGKEAKR